MKLGRTREGDSHFLAKPSYLKGRVGRHSVDVEYNLVEENVLDSKDMGELTAKEVLVFDSSTFIAEVGLTSGGASALRHYLYLRGIQLAVPQVVAEECERRLNELATEKVASVRAAMGWLSRLCGSVNGWTPPTNVEISERVKALASGEAFEAVVLKESETLRRAAEERHNAKRPPSHNRDSHEDCKIWEQCLDLLRERDVIFVSNDRDFRVNRKSEQLHPRLRAEADRVPGGRLTFHAGMSSLLSDLRAEMPELSTEKVFTFVYKAIAEEARKLKANSECQPTSTGTVEQQMFATDRADVVAVRLKVKDRWRSSESNETLEFRLWGSCQYHLSDCELCNLSVSNIGLYMLQPDGSKLAVTGSYVRLSGLPIYVGARPIKPEPAAIGPAADAN